MRLIDADAVLKAVNDFPFGYRGMIRNVVYNAPTIDAVEVVRCKECKYVGTDATCCFVCERDGMGLKPYNVYHDDFCSYGERRSENENNE